MKRANRMSVTAKYVLLVSALMLLTNIVLSSVMIHQFRSTIQTLVRRDMLDISNTAAGLLDGDVLGELKEEDVQRCILPRLQLSNRSIGNIYGLTISAVQHRKLKLKKDLFGETDPDVTLEQVINQLIKPQQA